ncbi:MAG: hypothetical protein JXB32_26085, partial [Deltaproteobacteria bacterium]|nr:hypothetical protein [Deltaproteobacteria bacterium]
FLGGLARRPGWYIDTVAVSTSLLEGLPRLDGDPQLPGCGFNPVSYAQPDGNRTLPDPCVMGRPVVGPQVVEVAPPTPKAAPPGERSAAGATAETLDAASGVSDLPTMPATAESVDFETPAAGAVCLVIANGSGPRTSRVERGRVWLDGQEVVSANRFVGSATLLRQRLAVAPGKHTLRIEADAPSDAASNWTGAGTRSFLYQVLFQAGNAMPAWVPPAPANREDGTGVALNFTTGRLRSERVAKLEFETAVPAVGLGKQGYVVPFVVQLADARTCRQVRELRGTAPVGTDTRGGWEDALASAGLTWDGRDESGRPVQAGNLFARISFGAALAGLETFPVPTSGEMEPRAGDWVDELPPWVPTGPPVPRFGPFVPRTIAVRWGPRLFTPHQDGFCTTPLACSLDRDPDLSWSCAPNVGWRTSGTAAGWTVESRRICLAGYYPPESSYGALFEQDGTRLVSSPVPPVDRGTSGWWLEFALPAVGNDPAVIGPATPRPGAARVTVHRDGVPMGSGSEFTFRPPYAACIRGAGSDGGFVPGERAEFRGHLLRTYRVRFELSQPASGVREDLGPVDDGEAEAGALAVGHADMSFSAPLPTRLLPGPAHADPQAVDSRVTVRQAEAACSFPLSLEILGPEVHEIDPDYGRVCPASDDCATAGEGRACLEGERLGLDAWGDPEIRIGTLTVPPDEITQVSERRVCFDVPESLHGTSLGSEVRVKLRYRTAAPPGIDVPCIGGDCVRDSGTGSCDGSVPCHLPFVVTGRKDGAFEFYLDSPLYSSLGWISPPCRTTVGGRSVTVTAEIDSFDYATSTGHYRVRRGSSTVTSGNFRVLGGYGGVAFGKSDCRSFVVLSHVGATAADREFSWSAMYLGPDITAGQVVCVGCGERFTDEEGIWRHMYAGFSPDGSVLVRSVPTTARRMAVSLYDVYGRDIRLGGTWFDTTLVGSPAARIRTNRVVSVTFGSAVFVPEARPIDVPRPDPNDP